MLIVVSYRMRWRVFPATWDGQQREGDVAQIVDEDVNGVRVVKAFGQEDRELDRMVERREGAVRRRGCARSGCSPATSRCWRRSRPSARSRSWPSAAGSRCTTEITLGTFLAFSTYVAQFVAPARQLAGVLTVGQQARAGVERIFQLLDLPPAIADADDAIELPELRGEITFGDVRFGYPTAEPVLDGFDLHVAAGERVAIVGPSGSGKSTVAMLVSRFYDPDSGAVLVDGHDVRTVTLHVAAPPGRRRVRGQLPVLRHGSGEHRLRQAGRDRRRGRGGGARGRRRTSSSASCPTATTPWSASAA